MLYYLTFFLAMLLWAEISFSFWRKPSPKVVEGKISDIVRRENHFKPISDSGIVAKLADKGILLLTRAVQLHRQQLGIPGFKQRRRDALKQEIDELVAGEGVFAPITDQQILGQLQQQGVSLSLATVEHLRHELGIPPNQARLIKNIFAIEPPSEQYTDKKIAALTRQHDVKMGANEVSLTRQQLGIGTATERRLVTLEQVVKEVVDGENHLAALDDVQVAAVLKERGIFVSNHTIRRARSRLGLPEADERRVTALANKISAYLAHGGSTNSYTDQELADMLAEDGATLTAKQVGVYRRRAGVISFFNKVRATREQELKEFIAAENKLEPWSDVKLAELLQEAGLPTSEKKIRKLRYQLGIPSAQQRLLRQTRDDQIRQKIQQLVEDEPLFAPLTARDLVARIQDAGFSLTAIRVGKYLRELGIPPSNERKATAVGNRIGELIANEDPSESLSDIDLVALLRTEGVELSGSRVQQYRSQLAIPHYKERAR